MVLYSELHILNTLSNYRLILVGMRFTSIWSVNDLAFCNPVMQLCAITCGDDKAIKVWNATTGSKLYTFEGHDTPVHSVCPHNKQNVNFFFSTSVNGKIKAWLYNNMGYQVDYDASDHSITTMAYSADGKRLFSCGTSKDGESHVVEWNENDGVIKRNYVGFQKPSSGVVQFDTSKNKYLSVGDDYAIKVWDMDKVNILTAVDAEGGLPLPETWIRKGYHNLFDRIKMGQQS